MQVQSFKSKKQLQTKSKMKMHQPGHRQIKKEIELLKEDKFKHFGHNLRKPKQKGS